MIYVTVLVISLAVLSASSSSGHRPFYPTENYNGAFFQGDILLKNRTFEQERFATSHKTLRWPNGVVYYILDEIYSESDKELIRSAMDEFEKETCIKWVERTNEEFYVDIYNDRGCFSQVGRVESAQSLSLESPICMKKGVILHELMHTLGFLHEQSRQDRDNYVSVDWDNIIWGAELNFEKMSPLELDDLGLKYDYRSVMHYGAWMYSKEEGKPTLIPVDSDVSLEDLGSAQSEGAFTDLDIQKINKFYECPQK